MIKYFLISFIILFSTFSYSKDKPNRQPQSIDFRALNKAIEDRLSNGYPYMFCLPKDEFSTYFNALSVKFSVKDFKAVDAYSYAPTGLNRPPELCALLVR